MIYTKSPKAFADRKMQLYIRICDALNQHLANLAFQTIQFCRFSLVTDPQNVPFINEFGVGTAEDEPVRIEHMGNIQRLDNLLNLVEKPQLIKDPATIWQNPNGSSDLRRDFIALL